MIENVHSVYNAPSVYNQGGGGGAVDYKPLDNDNYKRLAYIRRYNVNVSYIAVYLPLKYTDKIRGCYVFNFDISSLPGYIELWLGGDAGFRTKIQRVDGIPNIMNKWNYIPGGGSGFDFPFTFTQGVFNLFVDKDTSTVNGTPYPVTKGTQADTNVRRVCNVQAGSEVNVDFYNFVIMDEDGKTKYSLYPALRTSDNALGAYCEENSTFYPATNFNEAGPIIE